MAKGAGGVRGYKKGTPTYEKRVKEAEEMYATGKYISVEVTENGGIIAIEKSSLLHSLEEVEAAKILANKGYKVVLTNEAGSVRVPDGKVFMATYEQKTPNGTSDNNCKKALEHAKKKNADVALIYDKYHNYHRETVEKGLKLYEEKNSYRFKYILVVTHDGKVHRHKHNS